MFGSEELERHSPGQGQHTRWCCGTEAAQWRHNTPFPQCHVTPSILAAMVRDGPVGMHAWCRVVQWTDLVCDGQSKGCRRGSKLVACLNDENQVVILDLDTGAQKVIEVKAPWKWGLGLGFSDNPDRNRTRYTTLDAKTWRQGKSATTNVQDMLHLTLYPQTQVRDTMH